MIFIKKIWKDPVGSKVIAAGLIFLFGLIYKLYTYNWNINLLFVKLILNNYQIIIIIVLIIVVFLQFYYNRKNPQVYKKKDGGIRWILKLDNQSFQKYLFLYWFYINRRVQTNNIFLGESLNHVPEIRELYDWGILFSQPISGIEYVIEIDKEVYNFVENTYLKSFKGCDAGVKSIINQYKSMPFQLLFPKA
jgi:hypothetical protein